MRREGDDGGESSGWMGLSGGIGEQVQVQAQAQVRLPSVPCDHDAEQSHELISYWWVLPDWGNLLTVARASQLLSQVAGEQLEAPGRPISASSPGKVWPGTVPGSLT